MDELSIAVTSRSFSKNEKLRKLLLSKYKNVKFNEEGLKLEGEQLIHFLKDCDKAIVALEKITGKILNQLPKLKLISKYGVGLDNIDFESLQKHNVKLSWKGGVNKRSVSELTLSFMLMFTREVWTKAHDLKAGKWNNSQTASLKHSTVGLVGFGNIGQDIAKILNIFGAKVIAYDNRELSREFKECLVTPVSLDKLLESSNFVSIHLPKIKSTSNFVDSDFLKNMNRNAYLINTSRGGIVDEQALYNALCNNEIAGAAMDVFVTEPEIGSNLFQLHNFIGTPHIAGSSDEGILNMGVAAIEGLEQGKAAVWENFYEYPDE
tara:strand:- start:59157 stop:60119 length:963 start_codon:yes stop_codon:yes gene_type:complete